MFGNGTILYQSPFLMTMRGNAAVIIKNVNSGICYPYIHFSFDVLNEYKTD